MDGHIADESDSQLSPIVSGMVRFVLSQAESQIRSTIISKTRFTNAIRDIAAAENISNIKYANVFDEVNVVLQDIYGFRLVGTPSRKNNINKNVKIAEAEDEFNSSETNPIADLKFRGDRLMLINDIPLPSKHAQSMIDQTSFLYRERIIDSQYAPGIESAQTLVSQLSTDQLLVLQGIMSIVICMVIFSKNNCLEQELFTNLSKFGIPTGGYPIPIINMKIQEVLNHMVKLEYIQRVTSTISDGATPNGQETIFYSIDRRTQIEFPQEALVAMCQKLLAVDETQLNSLCESIKLSIGDSYRP
ncbi:Smc5-Smc6 complex subunit NSE3 Ecym_4745 [Eremothecium cymbalariae DBVPG|uniref:MAGE domain-containing protein n=1 Tax=Eremothecium cymbalariae (strain CBS 270.75 / DBVPG 7215 / KCTC 17166 / NRRL Y-17582) TaxID=931890 RepID=G8JSP0_ERECY|nr:hypothetical protein Ecym_4745 [Eremothecium cymbalariae DBVPG\